MDTLRKLQQATLAARARTGDKCIGTRVEAGKFQIVRVTDDESGESHVHPLSSWGTADEIVKQLDNL